MPQIPVYDGPQVRTGDLRPVTQRTPDVSSGLMQVGRTLDQAGTAWAQAQANDLDTKVSTEWLKWDAENRTKFRGAAAKDYPAAVEEWWKKASETYGQQADPITRQLIGPSLGRKQMAAFGNAQQFAAAEGERHADETTGARIATEIQLGITNGDVIGARNNILTAVAEMGGRKGWTTEQVQAETLRHVGQLHVQQIAKMAERDPAKAQEYYDRNKAEVPAANQARIEDVIETAGDNLYAKTRAAEIAALPYAEQLTKAAEETKPRRREALLERIKMNQAMVRETKRADEEGASDTAWQLFAQGKAIPADVLARMDGKEREELNRAGQARSDRLASGASIRTDWATYFDLRDRIERGEDVKLERYLERLAPRERESLADIRSRARAGKPQQDSMLTDRQRIDVALDGLKIDPKRDPEGAARFAIEVDRRVSAASAAKGDKPLTPEEKQKVVDQVVLDKVYVDSWGPDKQVPLALVKPDDLGNAYVRVNGRNVKVSSVPSTDRAQIIAALRAIGRVPTEQAIVEMYLRGQQQQAAKPASPTKSIGETEQ